MYCLNQSRVIVLCVQNEAKYETGTTCVGMAWRSYGQYLSDVVQVRMWEWRLRERVLDIHVEQADRFAEGKKIALTLGCERAKYVPAARRVLRTTDTLYGTFLAFSYF